jgi:nucleoside-diphosphate-sugar epimerase
MVNNTRTLELPVQALTPLSSLVAFGARMRGGSFDLAGTLRFWSHRATFSMDRARNILNWQPKVTLAEGLRLTEPWLKNPEIVDRH